MTKKTVTRLQADEVYLLTQKAKRAGAYYWLKAEGQGEQLESSLMRLEYGSLCDAIEALGGQRPPASHLYAVAKLIWPVERLHPAPAGPEVGA
jgi:hypothetical protein